MSAAGWRRVSRETPCAICGKRDWCLVSSDGAVAICARIESPRRIGDAGWLHRLRAGDGQLRRWCDRRIPVPTRGRAGLPDFGALARQYVAAVDPAVLAQFARELGVSIESLRRMGIGWTGRAWSFPHTDGNGQVCGIHLRLPSAAKPYVKSSHPGLVVPSDLGPCDPLLITEGESDCAAALTLGLDAVARPGCEASTRHLSCFMRRCCVRNAVIFGDGDAAGQRGAFALGNTLVAYCPRVRVIFPPAGIEDLRAWVRSGASAADVHGAIESTAPLQVCVVSRRIRGRRLCRA